MSKEIKQFKLTNGSEVLCEIIEWVEEDYREIVVRNCMEIIKVQNTQEVYYIFRPWMHYVESNEDLSVINSDHIVVTANPHPGLLLQYDWAVRDAHVAAEERMEAYKSERLDNLDKITRKMKSLMEEDGTIDSSQPTNIIPFPMLF
jgi:hypothetical protein